jgi:hypothetical protein
MMFLVRGDAPPPASAAASIRMTRNTPSYAAKDAAGGRDYFCVGAPEDVAALRAAGLEVIELRDGWYEDDNGGGVAIWGEGKYWEVRDTPFSVKESCGSSASSPDPAPDRTAAGEEVNVRGAIFGL